jgi:hypothetical protein
MGLTRLFAQQSPDHLDDSMLSLTVCSAYFVEDLRWSIAGDKHGNNPNVLSELTWKNLRGIQPTITLNWNPWKALRFRSTFASSFIMAGTVTDTDYLSDDRTDANFNMTFDSDEGKIILFEISAGYHLFQTETFRISTYIGYGISQSGLFLLGDANNKELRSTYDATWKYAIATVGLRKKFSKRINIEPFIAYSQLNYNAKANWNLIQSFQHPLSFEHTAKGFRISASSEMVYNVTSRFAVSLIGNFSFWKTGRGVDKLYLMNNTTAITQFNGAGRKTFSIGIQATANF